MAVGEITTVGPVHEDTRDRLKQFRDRNDLPNYDSALRELLDATTGEDNA